MNKFIRQLINHAWKLLSFGWIGIRMKKLQLNEIYMMQCMEICFSMNL